MLTRRPTPSLRPFIEALWATDEMEHAGSAVIGREHVLPTGLMHVVFRLCDEPVRLFSDAEDLAGEALRGAAVGGARGSFFIREVLGPSCSVGAQLLPGAAQVLFGVPADELAGRHTALDLLWGRSAGSIREQLAECRSPAQRLDLFEAVLADRLPAVRGVHPAIAYALQQFSTSADVNSVVRASGYSHRTFIALFLRSVGLTPKRYCRVRRFGRAVEQIAAGHSSSSWADVAAATGYSDQAHFNRDFREFAGVTPGEYGRRSPLLAFHLPIPRDRR